MHLILILVILIVFLLLIPGFGDKFIELIKYVNMNNTVTNSIIFMALLISVFITIINIYNGFITTNKNYILLLKSFKASKWQIFMKAVLPSNLGTIINAFKINISMSLIGVIMGELLVSKNGLGYLIMYGSQVFNINFVILGIISYLLYFIVDCIEKKVIATN